MLRSFVLSALLLGSLVACGAGEPIPPQLQGAGQGPDAKPTASAFGAQVQGAGQGPDVKPGTPACKYTWKGACFEVPAGACKAAGCAPDRCVVPPAVPGEVACK